MTQKELEDKVIVTLEENRLMSKERGLYGIAYAILALAAAVRDSGSKSAKNE
jgi:hypothetical protein